MFRTPIKYYNQSFEASSIPSPRFFSPTSGENPKFLIHAEPFNKSATLGHKKEASTVLKEVENVPRELLLERAANKELQTQLQASTDTLQQMQEELAKARTEICNLRRVNAQLLTDSRIQQAKSQAQNEYSQEVYLTQGRLSIENREVHHKLSEQIQINEKLQTQLQDTTEYYNAKLQSRDKKFREKLIRMKEEKAKAMQKVTQLELTLKKFIEQRLSYSLS